MDGDKSRQVVGFNESIIVQENYIGPDTGNLPISDVRAIAIDNRNQLWIGTQREGVLSNVGNFQTENQ
jgi:ligand-binding sensor domain-containing protein